MDLKAILKRCGVEGELVDTLADTINAEIPKEFVSKTQYSKKVNLIDELNNTIADLEAKAGTDEYKTKYENLEKEHNDLKTSIETEKTNSLKSNALRKHLKAEGFEEKLIKLLEKNFDVEKIEVEDDKIKGWGDMIKPLREEYAGYISTETQTGNPPANPPSNVSGKNYTIDMLKGMSAQEIAQNYNAIQESLNKNN